MNQAQTYLLLVTGPSGAGRTTVCKTLEDHGFFAIDNLPVDLLASVPTFLEKDPLRPAVISMGLFSQDAIDELLAFQKKAGKIARVEILFLTADDDSIADRYSSTRRRHPLLTEGGELVAAIRREKSILAPIEEAANFVVDTSEYSPHQLARLIEERFSTHALDRNLHVTFTSFGFKYGLLKPADSIFDVRFLENPQFVKNLREKTGLDQDVKSFVLGNKNAQALVEKLVDLHRLVLPLCLNEGKHYFRVGIGCTGGKHRSVAIAEELAARLAAEDLQQIAISVRHRDATS